KPRSQRAGICTEHRTERRLDRFLSRQLRGLRGFIVILDHGPGGAVRIQRRPEAIDCGLTYEWACVGAGEHGTGEWKVDYLQIRGNGSVSAYLQQVFPGLQPG